MAKRSSKDVNELAARIVRKATEDEDDLSSIIERAIAEGKDPAAVLLGRRGGKKGGAARAKALGAQRRSEIAKKAAEARWKKKS
jgi:hypothetical protein